MKAKHFTIVGVGWSGSHRQCGFHQTYDAGSHSPITPTCNHLQTHHRQGKYREAEMSFYPQVVIQVLHVEGLVYKGSFPE